MISKKILALLLLTALPGRLSATSSVNISQAEVSNILAIVDGLESVTNKQAEVIQHLEEEAAAWQEAHRIGEVLAKAQKREGVAKAVVITSGVTTLLWIAVFSAFKYLTK